MSIPSRGYQPDQEDAEQARLEDQVFGLSRELAAERKRLGEVEQALARQRRIVANERKRYEAALANAKRASAPKRTVSAKDLARAEKRALRAEKKLASVYASRTWRAGRIVWHLFHARGVLSRRSQPAESQSPPPVDELPRTAGPERVAPHEAVERVDYVLVENHIVREKYEAALARVGFAPSDDGRNVAIAVHTTDMSEGRGDVFTAVGLGRHLEVLGYRVIYLPRDRWYDVPRHTDLYVAMLETVDPFRLPGRVTKIAWIRNQTEAWIEQAWLPAFDLVLCSSRPSLEAVEDVYAGPTGMLPLGVDTELFVGTARTEDRLGVVSTVNQWGREREVHINLRARIPDFPLALFGEHRGVGTELEPYRRDPVSFFALPSLYNQAAIVLDDFNHTTAAYGNVNSRVYEAAACGAVVMTNRPTGLDDLGLGDLPVYWTARDLFDLIQRDLASEEAREAAKNRQRVVLERHAYSIRAREFDGFVQRLTQSGYSPRDSERSVLTYFPDYRDNAYLQMMWSDLRVVYDEPMPIANSLDFTASVRAAAMHPGVFHINWTAPILGGGTTAHERLVRYRRFLEALDQMHDLGMGSIWTVHNVMPHECADPILEAQLRQELADRVDVVHVMCEATLAACAGRFEIPASKMRVLPHPSYIDVYPNLVDQQTARFELGLSADDFVYLHFGQIRPYKGVDRLLDAFDRVSRQRPNAKLLLVGSPGRFEALPEIMQRARANPNVVSTFNAVPDADVQLYLNAADVVVFPYLTALNSGALHLAYSFAKPVIASEVGCVPEQVDERTGITFRWEDGRQSLLNAMLSAPELGPEHGRAAYERAAASHYLEIGRSFGRLVEEASEAGSRRRMR